jgi:hypothetical protein
MFSIDFGALPGRAGPGSVVNGWKVGGDISRRGHSQSG